MSFNPMRLRIARQRRLLNKKRFAEKIGVAAHTVTRWECGASVPTEESVNCVARVLEFPKEFFCGSDIELPSSDVVSFRSQRAMSAAIRDAALSAGALGFLVSDWVERRFDLPAVNVPDLSLYDPAVAARALRQEWALGEKPISNVLHLLESKGVRVFSLAENTKKVNAFSLWRDEKPYIFLNTMKSAESSRFDASHELAHLVLHQDGKVTGREAEDQAQQFASSFLMPQADVVAVLPRVHSLGQIVQAKKRWRVSVAALNYRLHKLGIITDWKYHNLCVQISANKYNVNEPYEMEREKSIVWQKIMTTLWAEKVTQRDIARELDLPVAEVAALIYGILHAGTTSPPAQDQANLRLLKSNACD